MEILSSAGFRRPGRPCGDSAHDAGGGTSSQRAGVDAIAPRRERIPGCNPSTGIDLQIASSLKSILDRVPSEPPPALHVAARPSSS
jgi:hypothetical protein